MRRYIFPRFPEGKTKALTFSYDDGLKSDLKLAQILNNYGMKGSFNVYTAPLASSDQHQLTVDEIKEFILAKGHEVAIHGDNHIAPGVSTPLNCIKEILNARSILESSFDCIIRGMAYPDSGIRFFTRNNNYQSVRDTLKALGVVYSRTLGEDNNLFRLPEDWYAWMPTAHHNNPHLLDWVDEFVSLNVDSLYIAARHPRLMKIWGHSSEFDIKGNWDRIDEICSRLSARDDIWYATSMQIYEYVSAYDSLVFSADERKIYNPSLQTVWMYIAGNVYSVKSGETITVE